jgi:hypothetical protein
MKIDFDRIAVELGDGDALFRKNWATEAIRRRDEVRDGKVKTVSGDEALARMRQPGYWNADLADD